MQLLDQKLYFHKDYFNSEERNGFKLFFSNTFFSWIKTSLTGADILNKLDGNKKLFEVVDEISKEYMLPKEIVEHDVIKFCKYGIENKVIFEEKKECIEPKFDNNLKSLFIDITDACNLNCRYCNKQCVSTNNAKFMELESLKTILDNLTPLSENMNIVVNITGGEPLLHPNLEEILKSIKSYNCRIVLWTNGVLLDSKQAILLKEYCDYIIISLDEFEEIKNDYIRGDGSFKGVLSASEMCTRYDLPFLIGITPLKYNIDNLEKVIGFVKNVGSLGFIVNEPILIDSEGNNLKEHFNYDYKKIEEKNKELGKMIAIMNSWKNNKLKHSEHEKHNIIFVRDIQRCMNNVFSLTPKLSCGAGVNELSIDVNGNIYPCHVLHSSKFLISNAKESPVKSKPFVRTDELEDCTSCDYKIFCLGGCRAHTIFHTEEKSGKYPLCEYEKGAIENILWSPLKPVE